MRRGLGWGFRGGVLTVEWFLNLLGVRFFHRHVEHDFKRNRWDHLFEYSQMSFCIDSAAEASDNLGAHIRKGADDAPGMEPFE